MTLSRLVKHCNNIVQLQKAMTHQNKHIPPLNLNSNLECNCFDYTHSQNQTFLIKNKASEKIPSNHTNHKHFSNRSSKEPKSQNNQKRSLKKNKQINYLSPNSKDPEPFNDYGSPADIRQPDSRNIRIAHSNEMEIHNFQVKTSLKQQIPEQFQMGPKSPILIKSASCQNTIPSSPTMKPLFFMPPTSPHHYHPKVEPQILPKIYFNTAPRASQPFSIQPVQQISQPQASKVKMENQYNLIRFQTNFHKNNKKQYFKTEPQTCQTIKSNSNIINFSQQDILDEKKSIEIPKENKFLKKSDCSISGHEDLAYVIQPSTQIFNLKMHRPFIEDPYNSVIKQDKRQLNQNNQVGKLSVNAFASYKHPKKLNLEEGMGRSKIALKRHKTQDKQGKYSLKKMNDVQQIKSMIDSEQMANDSDKESVVLARLMEYDSNVDPSISFLDSTPTMQSKLGYQSTTAGKSLLRAFQYSTTYPSKFQMQ